MNTISRVAIALLLGLLASAAFAQGQENRTPMGGKDAGQQPQDQQQMDQGKSQEQDWSKQEQQQGDEEQGQEGGGENEQPK